MRPIDFPEANAWFEKPETMTDEECFPVSAYKGIDKNGRPYTNVVYMPSKEDIEAILAGRPIVVTWLIDGLIPHSLFTYDENGNVNE